MKHYYFEDNASGEQFICMLGQSVRPVRTLFFRMVLDVKRLNLLEKFFRKVLTSLFICGIIYTG